MKLILNLVRKKYYTSTKVFHIRRFSKIGKSKTCNKISTLPISVATTAHCTMCAPVILTNIPVHENRGKFIKRNASFGASIILEYQIIFVCSCPVITFISAMNIEKYYCCQLFIITAVEHTI